MIETAPAPIETVTPIKQSEALRLGCLIAPRQITDAFFDQYHGGACAYGAIVLGLGWGWSESAASGLYASDAISHILPCPARDCHLTSGAMPAHLNDQHEWTRERIADYLETQGL
jgi:hypothetical protein